MEEIDMRNRGFLVIFAGMMLTLFFASQVLAQASIEGWDKAKFGMTVEEVEAAYGEEIERLDRKDKAYYELSIFRPFRDLPCLVKFLFVDNKLFEIDLFAVMEEEQGVTENHRFWLLLMEIEDILERKYGIPSKEERTGDRKVVVWRDAEGNGLSLMVDFEHDDFEGYFKSYEKEDFTIYSQESGYFNIIYFHKELTEVWEQKVRTQEGMSTKIEAESF